MLKKTESGISVYNRKTTVSNYKEIRSVVYIRTSLKSLVALINDWDSYPKWVYKCDSSSTLKKINSTEAIHYQSVQLPWPAENRDFTANVKLTQHEETKTVTIKSVCLPSYVPANSDHIRIKELYATWILIPMKDGLVQITYELLVDPGGIIPAWFVNLASIDGPFETMLHFKDWVMKKEYQEANVSFIKELNESK